MGVHVHWCARGLQGVQTEEDEGYEGLIFYEGSLFRGYPVVNLQITAELHMASCEQGGGQDKQKITTLRVKRSRLES